MINIPNKTVKAVDTNGAGDLFAGAFLYGITNGMDHATAGALACNSSAQLVTQFGARLTEDQLLDIKKETMGFETPRG